MSLTNDIFFGRRSGIPVELIAVLDSSQVTAFQQTIETVHKQPTQPKQSLAAESQDTSSTESQRPTRRRF